jgi:trk system potassium uptake protein TrkH
MLVYGATMTLCTMLLTATGSDIVTAFAAAVACLNNIGPGLEKVGPSTTYAVLNGFQTWVCTAAMLLGRSALFTLVVVLTRGFWRN